MERINVRQAREQISQILDRVEAGEEVTIMRHGKPAARIVGADTKAVEFPSRRGLRAQIPTMDRPASDEVRELRDNERY